MSNICGAVHPRTGDVCVKPFNHQLATADIERQHMAENQVKWPTLHELNPTEGYNVIVPHRN